jgi:hypothetical protein
MYEDGFYVKENIIGYTGKLTSNPTVYFQKGSRFGRITQDHPNPSNIGRNKVRSALDYKISNSNGGKAQEYYNGAVQHSSRNPFKPANFVEKFLLSKAIDRFPDKKPK